MNIGIIGVGGVGGYFGGKLCRSGPALGAEIFFIARGPHLDAIRKDGLLVRTGSEGEWRCRPALATDRVEDLPMLDVCLVCVKSYDLKDAVRRLANRVSDTTAVLPLLNGIDIYDRIREDLASARVFPACVYIGTHIESPGVVAQQGGACTILFGKDPREPHEIPNALFGLFGGSGIKYEWFDNVFPFIWEKFIFIAPFSLVAAAFDTTLGKVMESSRLSEFVLSVMNEIAALARAKGIALPDTIVDESYRKGHDFPYETKMSFQRDFERADKPDERDLFGGTILRLGKETGIETPATRVLWEVLSHRKPAPK
jgi:2-dehydropantoate 2-reductase